MTGFVAVDTDKRITAIYWGTGYTSSNIEVDFPDEFDLENEIIHDYKVIDGGLIYRPLPKPSPEPTLNDVIKELLGVDTDE